MKKINPSLIGLLQALSLMAYCTLTAGMLNFFGKTLEGSIGFFGLILMLVIFVFSAAATGSIIFGYPAYLFLKNKQIKEALHILAFTLLYCLAFVMIATLLMAVFRS